MRFHGMCVIRRTIGCFHGTMKDVPRAMAKTAERNRPIVLLLPYITHTLSMRTTVNMRSDEYPWITKSHVLSTHAKLTCPQIQHKGMNAWSLTYK